MPGLPASPVTLSLRPIASSPLKLVNPAFCDLHNMASYKYLPNNSYSPPDSPIHEDNSILDVSMSSAPDSTEGIPTLDATFIHDSDDDQSAGFSKVREWLDASSEQQDQLQRKAFGSILKYVSDDEEIADLVYASSDFQTKLKKFIRDGQGHARELKERLAQEGINTRDVESISFSKVNRTLLENRLNVKFEDRTQVFKKSALDPFLQLTKTAFVQRGVRVKISDLAHQFSKYWSEESRHGVFLLWLDVILNYTSQKVEAGARQIIDCIFTALGHMIGPASHEVVQVPELKVRTQPIIPLFSSYDNTKPVILSGSIDYALAIRPTQHQSEANQPPTPETRALLEELRLSQDAGTLFFYNESSTSETQQKFRVVFAEAKKPPSFNLTWSDVMRRENRATQLKKHEGQVVAEAMAGPPINRK
ncbi:hypothetical protein CVT24_008833 [Panaeolus cyanescens]|uniref:Uncharacterized protein n=1 Tax=Panaeolus cyanescens TaxID=181874 RepID=A0A409VKB0_9AGAR|nr:hypothetical protein CVT24_008833 [Panaeolus cyanescens]